MRDEYRLAQGVNRYSNMKPAENGGIPDNIEQEFQFVGICTFYRGINVKISTSGCICCKGPCIFEAFDYNTIRDLNPPSRITIKNVSQDDLGTVVVGKFVCGCMFHGCSLLLMPNKVKVEVVFLASSDEKNLRLRVSGIEAQDIQPGSVLCSVEKPIAAVKEFTAQLHLHGVPDFGIFRAGYKGLLHTHSSVKEYEILELMQQMDKKTGKPMEKKPNYVLQGAVFMCRIQVPDMVCIEKYSDSPHFGRFTLLNDKGKPMALGVVTQLA